MPLVPSVPGRSGAAGGVAADSGRQSAGVLAIGPACGPTPVDAAMTGRLFVGPLLPGDLCVTVGWLAGGVSLICGATLALRRCTGSIATLPGPIGLLAVCAAGIVLVAASDVALRTAGRPGVVARFATIATRIGLMTALLAMMVPMLSAGEGQTLETGGRGSSSTGAGAAAMAVAVTAAAAAIVRPLGRARPRPLSRGRSIPSPSQPSQPMAVSPTPERVPVAEHAATVPVGGRDAIVTAHPGRLLQRLERYARPDGVDCLRGRVWLTLPAGSRSAHGHVGFCPPFAETPAVHVSTDHDELEAVVSANEVLPWGVRVECRLDEPADETVEVPVDLVVRCPA